MEPTEYDIRMEFEALRDIRRRSTTPGTVLDIDLPNQSSPPSPTTGALPQPQNAAPTTSTDDPLHLFFWVPASLHPEIAPAEFRAFLKEHARNPQADDGAPNALQRSPSASSASSGLGRKKSMLSRQYQPRENDSGDDTPIPLRRNRSSIYSTNQNQGPQLTISDLQKLEELAEEADSSDDPTKLRNILRRSLSLNVSPFALDQPDPGDEVDQPIVVAPPGQFLRRTARTRIRKPGLPGDGGGHRFGDRRRGASGAAPALQRTSSDVSSSDHGESVESEPPVPRPRPFSDEGHQDRPNSFSEEVLIYDAYARDEDELPTMPTLPPVLITESPTTADLADAPPPPQEIPPPSQPPLAEPLDQVIYQPQPTRLLAPVPDSYHHAPPSRTPSPEVSPSGTPSNSPPSSSFLSTSPSPRKDKDKKGLFKWGGDKEKEGKPGKASKKEREKEHEKESRFFGSLFGKKKHDSAVPEPPSLHGGREAAQALLGQSQRAPKSPGTPSPMGMMAGGVLVNNYSRYPIHVERAIYRLSHIKLANPRRPLYEQVLISNLMFWYLGVINKAQTPQAETPAPQAGGLVNGQAPASGQPGDADGEKEKAERERAGREAAEKERVEQERAERERAEREQWEREMEMKKQREASPRRGPLTKAVPPGGPQQRRAEMPVKGPQYEMQHRVMEKEYAGYNGNVPVRANTAPPPIGVGPGQVYPRAQQSPTSPKFNQQQFSQHQPPPNQGYYNPGETIPQQQQQRLPPGAMPPVDQSTWMAGNQPPRKNANSSPPPMQGGPPHRRSRSPPPPQMNQGGIHQQVYNPDGGKGGARLGGRSLSATAVASPPQQPNGKIRKGQSAYAGSPAIANGRRQRDGEEEDVPLAVWQRQQRR